MNRWMKLFYALLVVASAAQVVNQVNEARKASPLLKAAIEKERINGIDNTAEITKLAKKCGLKKAQWARDLYDASNGFNKPTIRFMK